MTIDNTTYINYLIQLSKSGRARSFLDLCEINLGNVFTLTARMLGDTRSAEEVSLKTFIYAWSEIKNFESGKSFVHWIKSIAIGYAMEEMQSQKEHLKDSSNNIEVIGFESEIRKLPTESRVIFVLHDLEGYTYKEIQDIFPSMIEDEIKTILIYSRQYLINKMNI